MKAVVYIRQYFVFAFNYKDGTKTVSLEELEEEMSSDLECTPPPPQNCTPGEGCFFI